MMPWEDTLTGRTAAPPPLPDFSVDDLEQLYSITGAALGMGLRGEARNAPRALQPLIALEQAAFEFFQNPGAGRLGMARTRMPSARKWTELVVGTSLAPPGRGYKPPSVDEVLGLIERLRLPVLEVAPNRGGTTYIRLENPSAPGDRARAVVIRVPQDAHTGQARSNAQQGGQFFDLGTELGRSFTGSRGEVGRIRNITENVGGGQYGTMENLEAALRWRYFGTNPQTTRLVPPDQAPLPARYGVSEQPAPRAKADPNQQELLFSVNPPITYGGPDGLTPIYAEAAPAETNTETDATGFRDLSAYAPGSTDVPMNRRPDAPGVTDIPMNRPPAPPASPDGWRPWWGTPEARQALEMQPGQPNERLIEALRAGWSRDGRDPSQQLRDPGVLERAFWNGGGF